MDLNQDSIRALAHQLWEEGGRQEGNALGDWLLAEQLIREREQLTHESSAVDESLRESFPASDAPSTHTADVLPINTEEKWAAAHVD